MEFHQYHSIKSCSLKDIADRVLFALKTGRLPRDTDLVPAIGEILAGHQFTSPALKNLQSPHGKRVRNKSDFAQGAVLGYYFHVLRFQVDTAVSGAMTFIRRPKKLGSFGGGNQSLNVAFPFEYKLGPPLTNPNFCARKLSLLPGVRSCQLVSTYFV